MQSCRALWLKAGQASATQGLVEAWHSGLDHHHPDRWVILNGCASIHGTMNFNHMVCNTEVCLPGCLCWNPHLLQALPQRHSWHQKLAQMEPETESEEWWKPPPDPDGCQFLCWKYTPEKLRCCVLSPSLRHPMMAPRPTHYGACTGIITDKYDELFLCFAVDKRGMGESFVFEVYPHNSSLFDFCCSELSNKVRFPTKFAREQHRNKQLIG